MQTAYCRIKNARDEGAGGVRTNTPRIVIRVRDNAGRRLALEEITDEFGNVEVAGGEEVLKKLVAIAESQQNCVVGKPQKKHTR